MRFLSVDFSSFSAMADRFRAFCKDEILTYAYLLLYIALSSGQIFFNKVLLLLLVFCVIALLIINQVFVTEKEMQFCLCVFGFGDRLQNLCLFTIGLEWRCLVQRCDLCVFVWIIEFIDKYVGELSAFLVFHNDTTLI